MRSNILLFCVIVSVSSKNLESYNIDPHQISVSGFSAGGFMAVQLHVVYSKVFMGNGIMAGGPYWCGRNSFNVAFASCLVHTTSIDVEFLQRKARHIASKNLADPVKHLSDDRIFIYSGKLDSVVRPGVVKATEVFYKDFIENSSNILAIYSMENEHGVPTLNFGSKCNELDQIFINRCNYNAAFTLLNHTYPGLQYPNKRTLEGSLFTFNQTEFFDESFGYFVGLDNEGLIFVPNQCKDRKTVCRLHISLHGCYQGREFIGDVYASKTGYNEVAAANNIIILYPQAKHNVFLNPRCCFDWWGYTGPLYATNRGKQMIILRRMVKRIADI